MANYFIFDTRLGYEVATVDCKFFKYDYRTLLESGDTLPKQTREGWTGKRRWRNYMAGLGYEEVDVFSLPKTIKEHLLPILIEECQLPNRKLMLDKLTFNVRDEYPMIEFNTGNKLEVKQCLNEFQWGMRKGNYYLTREKVQQIITRALEPLKRYRLRLDMLDGLEITYRVQQPESNHPFYLLYTEVTLTYYEGIKSWAITRLRHRTQFTGPKGEFVTATFRNPKKIPIQVLKAFTKLKL